MRILQTEGKLPTGKWLAKQREQNSQTIHQIAKAVRCHPQSVRALETKNRVVPPGWKKALGELGIKLPMPVWPHTLPRYAGADLKRDLDTRVGMRHSRFWLSKQLGVSEEAIDAVVRGNLPAPQDWLLKLAELGADVPEFVRITLLVNAARPVVAPAELNKPKPEPAVQAEKPKVRLLWPQEAQPDPKLGTSRITGASSAESRDERRTAPAAVDERRKQSLSVSWSEEAGLHVSLSAALLDQLPTALVDLLRTANPSSLFQAASNRMSGQAAEPRRG